MNIHSRLGFRDKVKCLPCIAQYGQEIEYLLTNQGLSDIITQLNGSFNYFNTMRMKKFKHDAKYGDDYFYLFAALLFALNNMLINYEDHDWSKYTFFCLFQFAIAKIKHFNYTMDRHQWNNFLDELKMSEHVTFDIGTILFPTLNNSYNEYEITIIVNNLFEPNLIKVESRNMKKIKHILEQSDQQLKFQSIEATMYHWFKHSMEDYYEYNYLTDGLGIISCEEYLSEANVAVRKVRIAKTSVTERGGKIFIEQTSDIVNTHSRVYKRDLNRYAIIEITFNINDKISSYAQIISYFKSVYYKF